MRKATIAGMWSGVGSALALVALGYGVICAAAQAQTQTVANSQTTAGEFVMVPPTLLSLGFEWTIAGDDNRTSRVEVAYRKKGEPTWRKGLPLLRLQREMTGEGAGPPRTNYGNPQPEWAHKYTAPNMFSGSILNLEPDTEYEARFTLTDVDGVKGEATKTVTARTRKEPQPAAGGNVYHVYPIGYAGPKQEPFFTGLFAAYYTSCHTSDFQNTFPPRVRPGDIILVHAGLYMGDRYAYTLAADAPGTGTGKAALCTLFDGTYYLTASGTSDRPIVIKGAGDGEVIFDGDGAQVLFNVMAANYNYFEGITVRNANVAFLGGIKNIAGSTGFTLKHSKLYDIGRGVHTDWAGSKNYYVADNELIGRHVRRVMGPSQAQWPMPGGPEILGGNGGSEYAVKVFGQGHVVAYNRVVGWHDGIDVATYGNPDGYCWACPNPQEIRDRLPMAIDFYNNDVDNMGDNCIEADGGARNIRIFRNRCFNSAQGSLSTEPTIGGPTYFYQNIVYNNVNGSVLKYVYQSSGVVTYANTFIGESTISVNSNMHFLNNLILGKETRGPVFGGGSFTSYSTSDYNGFRPNTDAAEAFQWGVPSGGASVDYNKNPEIKRFKSLREYADTTGQDRHSVLVDYDVFVNVTMPDRLDLTRRYKQEDYDFRLKAGSLAIDAGTTIPTITDGFNGRAPDLGALEFDRPVPHYGPRPADTGPSPPAANPRRDPPTPLAMVPSGPPQTATTAGEFVVEPPTLVSLGFEWSIAGDDNRTARVDVAYRKKGDVEWRTGLPLLRLKHEIVGNGAGPQEVSGNPQPQSAFTYVVPNMFSGSLLNLEPNTEYETRFTLTDPDGVQGEAVRSTVVRTRKEPQPATGGHVYHVYPVDYTGPKQEPSFIGLFPAYYLSCHTSDFQNAYPPRVEPGDVIMVHAGLYLGNRYFYPGSGNPPNPDNLALCTLFDGTYYLTASGTEEKPIVIKAAGDGEVIFDGDGVQVLFDVRAANYTYFEGLTVRNANVAFLAGDKNIAGASGFTLKNSRLYNVGRGVHTDWSGSRNFYIADNTFIGRHDPYKMMSWTAGWVKFPGYPELVGGNHGLEYAVKVYGQGHVVAHNFMANWHDGVDIATYGNPDGTPNEIADRMPLAIDFYGNDFTNMADNCVETDGGARNIRVFENRCFNSAGGALSAQPVLGGPAYFYRNLVYNTTTGGAVKHVHTSAGLIVYQNTFIGDTRVGPTSNEFFLNNLILGSDAKAPIFAFSTFTNYSGSDYNGFRPNAGADHAFEWNSPPFDTPSDYKRSPANRPFKSLLEYAEATGQDRHSVQVDYDVFRDARMPDRADQQKVYWPEDFDFRLKPGAIAVDAGTMIPTINDGFAGRAPDLGVYELDGPMPVYGPRNAEKEAAPALKATPIGGPPRMRK